MYSLTSPDCPLCFGTLLVCTEFSFSHTVDLKTRLWCLCNLDRKDERKSVDRREVLSQGQMLH
jgi:hypothetical protein